MKPGCTLSAKELSIAASIGKSQLLVSQIPRISIVTTGDELIDVCASPLPHQIRRSNDLALQFALQSAGYQNVSRHHILDNLAETETTVQSILQDTDILILAGGVSKGKRDFLPAALESVGVGKTFQWVSQRPGKPLWFGDVDRNGKRTLVFALPGNPVSTAVCALVFLAPAICKLGGGTPQHYVFSAPLTTDMPENDQRQDYIRATLTANANGQTQIRPAPRQDSSMMATLAHANAFIVRPPFDPPKAVGDRVDILPMPQLF